MALLGHSGSQAPQLMHSSVIIIAMTKFLFFAFFGKQPAFPKVGAKVRDWMLDTGLWISDFENSVSASNVQYPTSVLLYGSHEGVDS
jgi:hypothetical protein